VQVTPVEGRRHPRVITLTALGQASRVVVATALIGDGEIANYTLRPETTESLRHQNYRHARIPLSGTYNVAAPGA
jgi:hypothetical protein